MKISTEMKAIKIVLEYEKSQRREPENVSHEHLFRGFDIISRKKGKIERLIEVKGSTKKQFMPDAYESEFGRSLKLVASHLYLVGNINKEPILYIIPRAKIKKEYLIEKLTFRFSSKFQTKVLPECKAIFKRDDK